MGKTVKVKKQSTFIDMTAMSDVTVLLLTFFMLTATFMPKEPVQVVAPSSVSETKVPEGNVLTILINTDGKVFLNMDNNETKRQVLELMGQDYGITFNDTQIRTFVNDVTHVGVPIGRMNEFLNMPMTNREDEVKKYGVPMDSTNNQFRQWIKHAREIGGDDMKIAIKADVTTPYPMIDGVLKNLVKMKENRYSLLTNLRGAPSDI
ncbi:MAG: biopolymer transporter ExbD [Prevotella sp.]|jgi:biopolymer transport protein ExbD|nr:biopolymer transporter ExbD [Prevotella sp.]